MTINHIQLLKFYWLQIVLYYFYKKKKNKDE